MRCAGDPTPLGQVGGGGNDNEDHPQDVTNVADAISLAAGGNFGCAIRVGGTARCWGQGGSGQLGNGSTGDRGSSVAVQTLDNAVAISAGTNHACALRANGTVHCWGDNSSGQLGNNSLSRRTSPVAATGIAGDIGARAIASHSGYVCALRGNGTVSCWGNNATGQLGDGTTVSRGQPVAVAGVSNATQIAVGNGHSCARIADGTVQCWGRNDNGQVGDGTTTSPRLVPTGVPALVDAVAVATGALHTCVLRSGGSMQCWGDNQFGQLGDLTTNDSVAPRTPRFNTATPTFLTGVVALATAALSTCARVFDGNVLCWGNNSGGQLGINSSTVSIQTSPRGMLTSEAVALAAGNHSCVVRVNGTVFCTGGNVSGQIGDGTTTNRLLPTSSTGSASMLSVSVGAFHTCGIRGNGRAFCWGDNAQGQYGDGTVVSRLVPGVGPGLTDLTAIATGAFHSCAINAAGQVFCWGAGGSGALGDNTFANRLAPVAVPSFGMNIDPTAALIDAHKVEASVLALCQDDAHVMIRVTLTQGGATGYAFEIEKCTGAMTRYPVRIRALGRDAFVAGAARAELEGIVYHHGRVIDAQQWTRNITLVAE